MKEIQTVFYINFLTDNSNNQFKPVLSMKTTSPTHLDVHSRIVQNWTLKPSTDQQSLSNLQEQMQDAILQYKNFARTSQIFQKTKVETLKAQAVQACNNFTQFLYDNPFAVIDNMHDGIKTAFNFLDQQLKN